MRFSQRIGKTPVQTQIQIESMDDQLKSALWNCFHSHFLDKYTGLAEADALLISMSSPETTRHWKLGNLEEFFRLLWNDFFKEPFSDLPNDIKDVVRTLKGAFFKYD